MNDTADDYPRDFKLPQAFLSQLEEFSNGYCLFLVNAEGEPEVYSSYPNPMVALGLTNFCHQYFNALNKAQQKGIQETMEGED